MAQFSLTVNFSTFEEFHRYVDTLQAIPPKALDDTEPNGQRLVGDVFNPASARLEDDDEEPHNAS